MKMEMNGLNRAIRVSSAIVLSFVCVALFQNCGSPGESTTASSSTSGGNNGGNGGNGGNQTPTCPRNSNNRPQVTSISASSIDFNIGMGRDAGTDNTRTINASFNSGDNYSGVVDVRCEVQNNAGLNVNCQDPNNPSTSGTAQISISAANGAECRSGTVTVNVTVQDAIVNAQNAPINACNNLQQRSEVRSFTVNVRNACLPTQRVNPAMPYNNGQMGTAVAADGEWVVTSAPRDETGGDDAGAAIVFRRNGTTWSQFQKLVPSTLAAGDELEKVAISGNLIVLGAPQANGFQGAAWIYQFNGTDWQEVKVLTPPAGGGGFFGVSAAISGTNVAVGAATANVGGGPGSGAVHVFSGANWNSVTTLAPSGSPTAQGNFGWSLAYSGQTLAVGAPFENTTVTRQEAVYIFDNNVLSRKIVNPNNQANAMDRFGVSVSLDGDNLAVGAYYHTQRRGRAYLYRRAGNFPNTPTLQYTLADPNDEDVDHFGYTVAVKGTRVVVGAPYKAESAPKFGAVYLFSTANANQLFKIRSRAADRDADLFGYSVALTADGWLASGAPNDEDAVDNAGSIYFVRLP